MTVSDWDNVTDIFHGAIVRPPSDRLAFLDEACRGKPDLRSAVERLMRAHENAGDFIDRPLAMDGLRLLADEGLAPGERLGPYRLTAQIGHGGMGTVYLAERADETFDKRVAIKVITRGLDTDAVLGLFRHERQILAALEHPNIARLLDAGTTADGRPYFVLEHVEGQPIHAYCDARRLSIADRLTLFRRVCAAVAYAHQRLIVHCDIKPSNILVTSDGEPKLLDFGIAKLIDPARVGDAAGTIAAWRPLTPEYASPEQLSGLASTTLSDVYSLGVLLYELLAGRPPFAFETRAREDVARVIAEGEALKPSDAAVRPPRDGSPQDPTPEDVGARRGTAPERLRRLLRGDLDTIVLTALRADRERRYQSVEQLSEDVARHLAALPIAARRDAALYRAMKFVRRHRAGVAAAALVAAALVGGIAVASREAARADRAERAAVHEAATAKAVGDFLQNDLLAQAGPRTQAGPTTKPDPNLTVRTALDRAAARIGSRFASDPVVEAAIRQTIGTTYRDLGLYAQAEQQMAQALALRRRVLGADHPDTTTSMSDLGTVFMLERDLAKAEPLIAEALNIRRARLAPEDPAVIDAENNLATLVSSRGDHARAEQLYRDLLTIKRRQLGDEHADTLVLMNNLTVEQLALGKYAEAEALLRAIVETKRRVLGADHPSTLLSMNSLGIAYRDQKRYGEAESVLRTVVDTRRRVFGPDQAETLNALSSLALVYQAQGRDREAEALFRETLDGRRRVLGPRHTLTLITATNLGDLYRRERRFSEAETLLREAFEGFRDSNSTSWRRYQSQTLLGATLAALGRRADAEPLLVDGYRGLVAARASIPADSLPLVDEAKRWIVPR
jgi:serine/threonine protein kinase